MPTPLGGVDKTVSHRMTDPPGQRPVKQKGGPSELKGGSGPLGSVGTPGSKVKRNRPPLDKVTGPPETAPKKKTAAKKAAAKKDSDKEG